MAIQEQCNKCTYNTNGNCTLSAQYMTFNQRSCEHYKSLNINLEKEDDISKSMESNCQTSLDILESEPTTETQKQRMFSRPFSFNGRIRRMEYWLSYIILYIFYMPLILTDENNMSAGMAIFYCLALVPVYWFMWAQGAKRCHDRNNSGWYQLIPFYGLWMCFGDGDEYENDYGTDPKGRNIYA